ncbi:hypothetical protein KC19_4G138300 [Ceratodon purpureus]|uniref:Uncharacterized protein n=1 Tax=Ceratodon purpureus TaxID=3225 RepID=A0A8T0I9B1_CERPU|nr:hypothetical protein KC19_4G138300 [Ceratodon purpureus]
MHVSFSGLLAGFNARQVWCRCSGEVIHGRQRRASSASCCSAGRSTVASKAWVHGEGRLSAIREDGVFNDSLSIGQHQNRRLQGCRQVFLKNHLVDKVEKW